MLMDALNTWLEDLQRTDYAPATVARYASAIRRFLAWYQQQERRPLRLDDLTPIALANYRSAVQQSRATSTTNVHVAALRTWCY